MSGTTDIREQQRLVQSRMTTLDHEIARNTKRLDELTAERDEVNQAREALEAKFQEVLRRIEITEEARDKLHDQRREQREEEARLAALAPKPRPKTDTVGQGSKKRVLEIATRFGAFTAADVAASAKITPKQAIAFLSELVADGKVIDTGAKFQRSPMYELADLDSSAPEPEEEAPVEPAPEPIRPRTDTARVRDWVVARGDGPGKEFAPRDAAEALELDVALVEQILTQLARRAIVASVGLADMPLWIYVKPTEAGKAAERDMQRRKELAAVATRTGGGPVSGTGQKLRITDPDVRKLVADATAAGATVTHAPNGHFAVAFGGKSPQIAATPSSRRTVLNDRARLRREGLAV